MGPWLETGPWSVMGPRIGAGPSGISWAWMAGSGTLAADGFEAASVQCESLCPSCLGPRRWTH